MKLKKILGWGILTMTFFIAMGFNSSSVSAENLRCIAFSPYVDNLNPNWPPHPTPQQIEQLLDHVVQQTGFKCVLTYGVLNGLDYVIDAAHARGLKVVMGLWLDTDLTVNSQSISTGIAKAKQFPDTVIRLSCGVEFRNRRGAEFAEPKIESCISQVKAAGVTQPLTAIDTWWQWCNESITCQPRALALQVDWIGINIYPWWENKYSGLYPCTTVEQAPDFHLARVGTIQARYPEAKVMLTEFGWPAGLEGYTETNLNTGQKCGVAGEANQRFVITETIKKLDKAGIDFSLFEAYREPWKTGEGSVGPWWGICDGTAPYHCHGAYGYIFTHQIFLPFIKR
jgi:exo-beta-1,3-glucanase (GH17 family)